MAVITVRHCRDFARPALWFGTDPLSTSHRRDDGKQPDEPYGPLVVCGLIFVAVLLNFILRIKNRYVRVPSSFLIPPSRLPERGSTALVLCAPPSVVVVVVVVIATTLRCLVHREREKETRTDQDLFRSTGWAIHVAGNNCGINRRPRTRGSPRSRWSRSRSTCNNRLRRSERDPAARPLCFVVPLLGLRKRIARESVYFPFPDLLCNLYVLSFPFVFPGTFFSLSSLRQSSALSVPCLLRIQDLQNVRTRAYIPFRETSACATAAEMRKQKQTRGG